MIVTIYHNSRCSKSRKTLQILQSKNLKFNVIKYLKSPPSAQDLRKILQLLGMKASDLIRKNEEAYKSENLADSDLTESDLIDKMIEHPILIERPIVIAGSKAVIGRPPENVLDLI